MSTVTPVTDGDAGTSRIARFGPYTLDLDRGELWRDGSRVELRPKPTQVLVELVENAGRLVSHDELTAAAWGEGYTIVDSSLHTTISQLREALDDDATRPRWVQTVHRRGYRFVGAVEIAGESRHPTAAAAGATVPPYVRVAVPAIAAVAVAAILVAVVLLAPADGPASATEPTDAVLRGRYLVTRGSPGDMERGRDLLREAVDGNASDSAVAWASLGRAELRHWRMEAATAAARRALEIEPGQADALAVLGEIDMYAHRDWLRAERRFVRSLTLDPHAPAAHGGYATLLVFLGRDEEAVREARLARRQAPLSLVTNSDLAWVLTIARRFEEAARQARATLELDPDYAPAYGILHSALDGLGDSKGARDALVESLRRNGADDTLLERIRALEPDAGRRAGYEWLVEIWAASADELPGGHLWAATGNMLLGHRERALESLQRSAERNEPLLPVVARDHRFAPLHDDPRFRRLIADLGLAQRTAKDL